MINNYNDFVQALHECGFSIGGGNSEGIYSVCEQFGSDIVWHTGDPDTDPWQWRMRVLEDNGGIYYAKVFFKKSGFITREWLPYFLSVRRAESFDEAYEAGEISSYAKRVYDVVADGERVPFEVIKQRAGFGKDDKSKFERAIVELQMRMYITICGQNVKHKPDGSISGWSSTVFCLTDSIYADAIAEAARINPTEAAARITAQIRTLNPAAEQKKITKFIHA